VTQTNVPFKGKSTGFLVFKKKGEGGGLGTEVGGGVVVTNDKSGFRWGWGFGFFCVSLQGVLHFNLINGRAMDRAWGGQEKLEGKGELKTKKVIALLGRNKPGKGEDGRSWDIRESNGTSATTKPIKSLVVLALMRKDKCRCSRRKMTISSRQLQAWRETNKVCRIIERIGNGFVCREKYKEREVTNVSC